MSNLGDYLGQLMSEIAMARMQADLETIRLAELYASHPLLRYLPVPHVRLPDVDLDIPVLIRETQPPRPGESSRGGASPRELRRTFDQVLKRHLQRVGVKLTQPMSRALATMLDAREHAPPTPVELAVGVQRAADDYTASALRVLRETGRESVAAIDAPMLQQEVRLAFLQLRSAPPRLDVVVSSAEIREGASAGAENVARIRLKIAEQGVEWARIESNGESRDVLVPE